jgi:restriction system protein
MARRRRTFHSRPDDPWRPFEYALARVEHELESVRYQSVLDRGAIQRPLLFSGLPRGAVAISDVDSILSEAALAAPHGLAALQAFDTPLLPALPDWPDSQPLPTAADWTSDLRLAVAKALSVALPQSRPTRPEPLVKRYDSAQSKIDAWRDAMATAIHADQQRVSEIAVGCATGNDLAIEALVQAEFARRPLPDPIDCQPEFHLDTLNRVGLCVISVPDFARLQILKPKGNSWRAEWRPVSTVEKRRVSERLLYGLAIRAAYLTACCDPDNCYDVVAVNTVQKWHDAATGAPQEGVTASLQASKGQLINLKPWLVEPKECFRHLRGIATPSVERLAPVRPIFVHDTADNRIVAARDVDSLLESEANLAAMSWDDFEHLIRQLFEWEFGTGGVEVKVTQASRDRGVDAIMFDPDPLRGGKYVLQAKRYTNTVGVSAVRDLYGTVINEGANRGILVTTSRYGPDAYEFAKGKPISLIDGPNLLAILERHGRKFRIDLAEARRLAE